LVVPITRDSGPRSCGAGSGAGSNKKEIGKIENRI
jgi:hypothetical protein